jgi:hypothetical protein
LNPSGPIEVCTRTPLPLPFHKRVPDYEKDEADELVYLRCEYTGRKNSTYIAFVWDNIKMDLQEVGWGALTGLIWLRIGTGGGLL